MKKLFLGIVVFLVTLMLGTGVIFADTPGVVIDPIPTLSYSSFPQIYNVTGTITNSPSIQAINELKLFIDGTQEGATIDPTSGPGVLSATFSLPWNINGPGTYTVKVTAKHGSEGMDEEIVLVEQTIVVLYYPAAPAIAAHYLKSLGEKSGSKTFKNVISLVAQYMGPTTDFNGVTKEDPSYESTVENYVDGLLSSPVPK